eukprot:m.291129 g.291129  ORF g.291129 m.291129 type:complete len:50 (+) comp17812_c0_seq4:4569-4718(+)
MLIISMRLSPVAWGSCHIAVFGIDDDLCHLEVRPLLLPADVSIPCTTQS